MDVTGSLLVCFVLGGKGDLVIVGGRVRGSGKERGKGEVGKGMEGFEED